MGGVSNELSGGIAIDVLLGGVGEEGENGGPLALLRPGLAIGESFLGDNESTVAGLL
jgi:hypothetical protein